MWRYSVAPGAVLAGVLPDRGLRRAHLRQHAVEGQPLDAVAAAEAVDLELAVAAEDLEGEQVLPLGAARVQPGDLPGRRLQQQEAVVLDRHLPEERRDVAAHLGEVAGEPASQVDQVDALVEQLAAAGDLRIGAPFAGRSRAGRRGRSAPGRTSAGRCAPSSKSARAFWNAGWKRWLKPTLTITPRVASRPRPRAELGRAPRGRLLDQDVLAARRPRPAAIGARRRSSWPR